MCSGPIAARRWRARRVLLVPIWLLLAAGCGDSPAGPQRDSAPADSGSDAQAPDSGPAGLPLLGNGGHAPASVSITVAGSSQDGLNGPRDLAFHPDEVGQLWVVNQTDESMVIFGDATAQRSGAQNIKRRTLTGHHFLAQPAGVAFASDFVGFDGKRNLATIHETDVQTQGPNGTPADFMGPTLHTSDLAIFDGGHGGHIDMMHNSPNGMGIAWQKANVYWVFDGYHNAIVRYDFGADHGPGGEFHGDGSIRRYAQGNVKREPQVPSHLEFGPKKQLLYIADTGNNRVAVLDTSYGKVERPTFPNYDGGEQVQMSSVSIRTFIDGAKHELQKPCGVAIKDGVLYVSDNQTSRISAFDLAGRRLDWLDLGRPAGSIMGIELGPDGNLYVVDFKADEILRVEPL